MYRQSVARNVAQGIFMRAFFNMILMMREGMITCTKGPEGLLGFYGLEAAERGDWRVAEDHV